MLRHKLNKSELPLFSFAVIHNILGFFTPKHALIIQNITYLLGINMHLGHSVYRYLFLSYANSSTSLGYSLYDI